MHRGDVVECRGRYAIVCASGERYAFVVPVDARGLYPPHRSDVAVDFPIRDAVARVGGAFRVRVDQQTVVGHVSPELMTRLEAAMRREGAALAFEARHALGRPIRAMGAGL